MRYENSVVVDKEEQRIVAGAMKRYGVSFISKLGAALAVAEGKNAEKIKRGFNGYWVRFLARGRAWEEMKDKKIK